ncbi:MAG: hydantoinase B/oxoprolinase family protein, partial [Paracoccaceae bacterium]|nr:hydantoinase B/oxoprolinase family protein [Paracoccaceae bacterium]
DALGMTKVLIHPYAGVLSAYGMGLAEIRALREIQFDAPLADVDAAKAALEPIVESALGEVRSQGVSGVETDLKAHLRYDGSHQALEVTFGSAADMLSAFNDAHQTRFGFVSPERPVLFEMLSAEAIGLTGETPTMLAPSGDGCSNSEISVWHGESYEKTPLFAREQLNVTSKINGPAVITESTGTNVIEQGWTAKVDELGNIILERTESIARSHAAGTKVDPVLLEVFNNLFMSVADQMGATLANTSWSVNIKERLDFSCAIFDRQGDLVANAPHVPVHLGSMAESIKTVMEQNPDVQDGDAFMLNSPYNGGTHLPDVTVVTPVFVNGEAAFWLGSRGHHADIGGRTPGSAPPDSTHIDEEGVLIDNVRLVRDGVFLEDVAQSTLGTAVYPARNIVQNLADLKAQVAANATGRRELLRVADHYSLNVVEAYMGHVQDNAEECVRRVIDRMSDGRYSYQMDHGAVIEVAINVDQVNRSATIDFTDTSDQHTGNYNAPRSICRAVVLYVFRTLVGSDIPLNEGCMKPLKVIIPEGSMLNPVYPAAVIAGNTEVSQATCNALYAALGVMAGSQATMNNFVWGNDAFQNYETIAGGTGAGPGFNGCDAVQSHMTNTRMTDPEILEKRFPVRLEEFGIRSGSGGRGEWHGGEGAIRRVKFLDIVTVTTLCSHREIPPFGVAGGSSGAVGRNWAEMPDGEIIAMKGNDEIDLPIGAVFGMETPAGGGWGMPRKDKS